MPRVNAHKINSYGPCKLIFIFAHGKNIQVRLGYKMMFHTRSSSGSFLIHCHSSWAVVKTSFFSSHQLSSYKLRAWLISSTVILFLQLASAMIGQSLL